MFISHDNLVHYSGSDNYFNYTLNERDDILRDWYIGGKLTNNNTLTASINWLKDLPNKWCILLFRSLTYYESNIIYFEKEDHAVEFKLRWM